MKQREPDSYFLVKLKKIFYWQGLAKSASQVISDNPDFENFIGGGMPLDCPTYCMLMHAAIVEFADQMLKRKKTHHDSSLWPSEFWSDTLINWVTVDDS